VSFKSSIGSGRTNQSNGNYKKEACVARKHLKKRGSDDHQKLTSSESLSSKAIYQKLASSEAKRLKALVFVKKNCFENTSCCLMNLVNAIITHFLI